MEQAIVDHSRQVVAGLAHDDGLDVAACAADRTELAAEGDIVDPSDPLQLPSVEDSFVADDGNDYVEAKDHIARVVEHPSMRGDSELDHRCDVAPGPSLAA